MAWGGEHATGHGGHTLSGMRGRERAKRRARGTR